MSLYHSEMANGWPHKRIGFVKFSTQNKTCHLFSKELMRDRYLWTLSLVLEKYPSQSIDGQGIMCICALFRCMHSHRSTPVLGYYAKLLLTHKRVHRFTSISYKNFASKEEYEMLVFCTEVFKEFDRKHFEEFKIIPIRISQLMPVKLAQKQETVCMDLRVYTIDISSTM